MHDKSKVSIKTFDNLGAWFNPRNILIWLKKNFWLGKIINSSKQTYLQFNLENSNFWNTPYLEINSANNEFREYGLFMNYFKY